MFCSQAGRVKNSKIYIQRYKSTLSALMGQHQITNHQGHNGAASEGIPHADQLDAEAAEQAA